MLGGSGLRFRGYGLREQIEGTGGRADLVRGNAEVAGRRGQAPMPQEQLNGPHIGSALEQMDRKGVAHGVRGDGFGDAGSLMRFPARQLDSIPGDVAARDITWEEPRLGLFETPPL